MFFERHSYPDPRLPAFLCRKARELLRKGVPVGEVFDRVGFESISYFSRTYKRMLGVTLSAHYRKGTK